METKFFSLDTYSILIICFDSPSRRLTLLNLEYLNNASFVILEAYLFLVKQNVWSSDLEISFQLPH